MLITQANKKGSLNLLTTIAIVRDEEFEPAFTHEEVMLHTDAVLWWKEVYGARLIRIDAALDFDDPPETRFTFWTPKHKFDVLLYAPNDFWTLVYPPS